MRNANKILSALREHNHRWDDKFKIDLKATGCNVCGLDPSGSVINLWAQYS